MKRSLLRQIFAVIILVLLAGYSTAHGRAVWDVTADFSVDNGNPNGAWSYGWMDTGFTTFTLYESGDYDNYGGSPTWYTGWKSYPPYGVVWRNIGSPFNGVDTGQLSLHPGSGNQPGVARWTAPAGVSGFATIAGQFFAGDGGWMLVDVRINGVEVWNASDHGVFNLTTTIVPGDTIDFAAYGAYYSGNTPLDATITVMPPLQETSYTESNQVASLSTTRCTLQDGNVVGDLNGTFDFNNFDIVTIKTGPWAGKGFSKAQCQATLEGVSYTGEWRGTVFFKPDDANTIYLNGSITGEILATVEGTLTESIPASGVYDRYQATWKIGKLGGTIISAIVRAAGTLTNQNSTEYPGTGLYVLQTAMDGNLAGDYNGPLSTVINHVRIADGNNPYNGCGFSIFSYVSDNGSGQGYTCDELLPSGVVTMQGFFTDSLYGVLSAVLNETTTPRTFYLSLQRVDLGLPPMADLKVKIWGPTRVSPGQIVDYIIEYRNDGLKEADNTIIFFGLNPVISYISSSYSLYNNENGVVEMNLGTVPAKKQDLIRVTGETAWGLSQGTELENSGKVTTPQKPASEHPDVSRWRTDLQVGDIVLAKYKNSSVPGYWSHAGGVVFGTYTDNYSGQTYEGWFVIEAKPGKVVATDIKWWDFPRADYKEDVVLLRVDALTSEQKNTIADFWSKQIGKPYQNPAWPGPGDMPMLDSSITAPSWYCSELVWAPYYNLGLNFNGPEYGFLRIAPSEIYESENVRTISFYTSSMFGEQNNIAKWSTTVATARDPSVKYGPEGNVLPGQRLDYRVEYENEGEGIAFGVYFTDTLDEDLNDATLEIGPIIDVNTGLEIAPSGVYNPATRTITWFAGEVGSHCGGYTDLSINVRSDANEGTEIINYATIYFPSVPEETRTNGIVSIVSLNQPPVANAGPDQTVYAWIDGRAEVNLDGSNSNDPDGDMLTYKWTWTIDANTYEANGVSPTIELPVGQHVIPLIVNDGIVDSEPNEVVITVIGPIEANLNVTPKVINCRGNQPKIMTTLRLPKGITKNQIDTGEPILLYPGEIEAAQIRISQDKDKCRVLHTVIQASFDKNELMDAIPNNGRVELVVVGQLKTGQYFFGSDNISVICPGRWPWHRPWFNHRWNRRCRGPATCRH